MADPTAFPNLDTEKLNLDIKKSIEKIKKNLNIDQIKADVKKDIEVIKGDLEAQGLFKGDVLSSEQRNYVNALPSDYKKKAELYLDIFRNNPDLVSDYLTTLKQFGSEKAAKEAGADNPLFYTSKIKKYLKENVDKYDEDTQKRWEYYNYFGEHDYNIQIREDDYARKYQKEWLGKWSTKAKLGITEAAVDTTRAISKTLLEVAAAVGSDNAADAVEWLEANWPRADDLTYPNNLQPFAQDSTIQHLTDELTQFGIDTVLGGKLLKAFKWGAKKVAPGTFKKIADKIKTQKPLKSKTGKEVADSFGNIKYASSIAQKAGGWGLPVAVKYGLGRTITSETDPTAKGSTTFSEGFGFMPTLTKEQYERMTSKDKAIYSLKKKLIHGAEGTVLIGGLTKAIGVGGKALWGGTKWGGRAIAGPFNTLVLNPVSGIMKSRKTGIPQLAKGIRNAGGFIGSKVLRIPPYKNWAYFSTTQGPLKERILGLIESKILPPLRVRGPYTKEAKEIILKGEQMVRGYKKQVGLLITQIDRAIYDMLGKGFGNRIMTTSSVGAGRQHWDDVVAYLRGEVKLDALPKVLNQPAKDIQQLIEKLSKQIKPYVKSDEIKKEIIDGMGKYLTTSYRIFQGSFKPGKKEYAAAQQYFVDLIKKQDKKFKRVTKGHKLWPELNRRASLKVDEILQYGKEGSSPVKRLQSIMGTVGVSGILKKKQNLPKVIEDLMGKVDDPTAIIMDTVAGQAELLSHLFTHKSILREGLKSGWITTDPAKFAVEGVQKWVAKSLVPIKELMRTSNIDIAKIYTPGVSKRAGNYWTTPEIAEALKQDALWTDFLLQQSWYKPILAAKTTAQLSKTVLSLMTQARNFETAMFFSIMQGHVGSHASVMEAMKFVFGDVIGKGRINPIAMNKKLKEWADVGILDTSIVGGEVKAVIGDLAKGKWSSTDAFFKALMSNPIFRKATEFYQGSDSVWKAYGYEFTKSQLIPAIPIKGLTLDQAKKLGYVIEPGRKTAYTWADLVSKQFDEIFGMRWDPLNIDGSAKTYGDALRQIAGKYIRDVYPNYNIVPNLVAGWRRLPMGNFIAFRSENIRNIFNTMVYSMRELSSSNPYLRQMGAKRMIGTAGTLYGIEEGLRAFTGALTNIDEDWMKKYQRWFSPYYDKTSTLFPVTKIDEETKEFWTLNWTREQPYEGVQDAFATMFQELFNPVKDDETMAKRFFNAFFHNFEEDKPGGIYLLFEPFFTPALLLEKIQDIAPSAWTGGLGNNGVTKEGKIVYDIRNDSWGEILAKMFGHIVTDINPATVKNAKEVIMAAEGDFTQSGVELNTMNQITKMMLGLGIEKQNPLKNATYTIGDFTGRLKKNADDFRRDIRIVPNLINNPLLLFEEFENLQTNRYRELNRVYDFVMFLKNDLKLTDQEIYMQFKDRGGFGQRTISMILNGQFDPTNIPPMDYTSLLPKLLERINKTDKYKDNPLKLIDIYDPKKLNEIKKKWYGIPLGLNDAQLEEYFLTGEDPRLKDKDQELIFNLKDKKFPPSGDEKEPIWKRAIQILPGDQSNLPIDTPPVSQEVVQTSALPSNINKDTGLTTTEEALLSNTEKALRRKQRNVTV